MRRPRLDSAYYMVDLKQSQTKVSNMSKLLGPATGNYLTIAQSINQSINQSFTSEFFLLIDPHFPPSIFFLKYSSNRTQNARNKQLPGELKVGKRHFHNNSSILEFSRNE